MTTPDGSVLRWKRIIALRGPMTVEVRRESDAVGTIRPVRAGFTRARYAAGWRDGRAWRFEGRGWGFAGRTGAGWIESDAGTDSRPVITSRRTGFRERRVALTQGPTFHLSQHGFTGARYRLIGPDDAPLVELRNSGGPLRWTGEIRVHDEARLLGDHLPLLILYALFLAFHSPELHA